MFRLFKRVPILRFWVIFQLVLLAWRHLRRLNAADRHRLSELLRRGRDLDNSERDELRGLLSKLEPRAFAAATADMFSPVPLPRRFSGR
jgi:hypothetical protein